MPERVGPYRIEREIGRGGMGVVYLAHDDRLDRPVAIKALPLELAGDAARLERFEREARTLASLSHPNIAAIYGVEEQDGQKYLVLEYVEGETLADRLDRGPVAVDEAVEVAVEIAKGLEAAHEAGVIHRDLKPDNIKVTPDGRVKVLDFGLAKADEGMSSTGSGLSQSPTLTNPLPQHSPTIPGAILGTAAYMSPEQARGRRVDKRTDIWAFGVVLYEMLVGASPFAGETASDSIGAVLHKSFDLAQLPAGTPMRVRRVLSRCLERDKDRRYRDIGDARLELASDSLDDVGAVPAGERSGWPRAVVAALAVCVVGLAVAAGVLLMRGSPAPAERFITDIAPPEGTVLARRRGGFALSPDGTRLAFVTYREDNQRQLWVRDLGTGETRLIEQAAAPLLPFWNPDGLTLGFFSARGIESIDLDGGEPRLILSTYITAYASGAHWVDDETILYSPFVDEMVALNPKTGESRMVVDPLPDADDEWPLGMHMHPDDRHVVYYVYDNSNRVRGLFITDLSSGETKQLLDAVTTARFVGPDWVVIRNGGVLQRQRIDVERMELVGRPQRIAPDPIMMTVYEMAICSATPDVLAYLPALEGGTEDENEFEILDRETGETTPLGVRGELWSPQVSPDGTKIVYDRTTRETAGDIAIYDLERGIESIVARTAVNEQYPMWAYGGESVYYRGAGIDYIKRIDGLGAAEEVEEGSIPMHARGMTSDGSLNFIMRDGGIKVLETATGEIRDWLTTPAFEGYVQVGFDDQWVIYQSDAFGERRVMMRRVSGEGRAVQVSPGAATGAQVAGDEVFYNEGPNVMAVRVTFDEAGEPILSEPEFVVERADIRHWDVMPDGKRVLLITRLVADRGGVIRIIKNWTAGLPESD